MDYFSVESRNLEEALLSSSDRIFVQAFTNNVGIAGFVIATPTLRRKLNQILTNIPFERQSEQQRQRGRSPLRNKGKSPVRLPVIREAVESERSQPSTFVPTAASQIYNARSTRLPDVTPMEVAGNRQTESVISNTRPRGPVRLYSIEQMDANPELRLRHGKY